MEHPPYQKPAVPVPGQMNHEVPLTPDLSNFVDTMRANTVAYMDGIGLNVRDKLMPVRTYASEADVIRSLAAEGLPVPNRRPRGVNIPGVGSFVVVNPDERLTKNTIAHEMMHDLQPDGWRFLGSVALAEAFTDAVKAEVMNMSPETRRFLLPSYFGSAVVIDEVIREVAAEYGTQSPQFVFTKTVRDMVLAPPKPWSQAVIKGAVPPEALDNPALHDRPRCLDDVLDIAEVLELPDAIRRLGIAYETGEIVITRWVDYPAIPPPAPPLTQGEYDRYMNPPDLPEEEPYDPLLPGVEGKLYDDPDRPAGAINPGPIYSEDGPSPDPGNVPQKPKDPDSRRSEEQPSDQKQPTTPQHGLEGSKLSGLHGRLDQDITKLTLAHEGLEVATNRLSAAVRSLETAQQLAKPALAAAVEATSQLRGRMNTAEWAVRQLEMDHATSGRPDVASQLQEARARLEQLRAQHRAAKRREETIRTIVSGLPGTIGSLRRGTQNIASGRDKVAAGRESAATYKKHL